MYCSEGVLIGVVVGASTKAFSEEFLRCLDGENAIKLFLQTEECSTGAGNHLQIIQRVWFLERRIESFCDKEGDDHVGGL